MFFDEVQPKDKHSTAPLDPRPQPEYPDIDLYAGRIDADRLERFFHRRPADRIDEWFLVAPTGWCRPLGVLARRESPRGHPDELFFAGPVDPSTLIAPERRKARCRCESSWAGGPPRRAWTRRCPCSTPPCKCA